ncbi:MAG: heme-binding protein [Cyclobacteriaceae bacterium]
MKKVLILLLLLYPIVSYSQSAQKPYLSLEDALKISAAAEVKAKKENWNVVIAIMDEGGHLISLQKMDGVQIGSVEVAQAKAKTSVFFKRPSKAFEDMVKQGNVHISTLPNVCAVEGGLPIFIDGVIVGAIGISGVTSAQDGIIAAAALEGFGKK